MGQGLWAEGRTSFCGVTHCCSRLLQNSFLGKAALSVAGQTLRNHVFFYFVYSGFGNSLFPGRVDTLNTSPKLEEKEGFPSAKALSCRSETLQFCSKSPEKARGRIVHEENAEGGL